MSETVLSPVTIGTVGGTTLLAEKPDAGMKETAVYLPPDHQPSSKVNVLLWLHGYYVHNVRDLLEPAKASNATKLRESVLVSKKDIVLIAPFLGYQDSPGQGTLTLGKLAGGTGVQAFLEDTLAALARYEEKWFETIGRVAGGIADATEQAVVSAIDVAQHPTKKTVQRDVAAIKKSWPVPKIDIANLIIAGHSAGGILMMQATSALGTLKSKLKQCWGFDCLYGSGSSWAQWATGQGADLFFYFGRGTRPSFNGDVNGFWTEIFGTPKRPKSGPLTQKVRLAPAVEGTGVDIDTVAFQSMKTIQEKAKPGNRYEEVRKETDPLIADADAYWSNILNKLKDHFPVVLDLLTPRIQHSGL